MLLVCARALPQEPASAGTLRSYLQGIALRQLTSRKELISEIHTPEQFEKGKAKVHHLLLTLMGGLPEERAALNIQKIGITARRWSTTWQASKACWPGRALPGIRSGTACAALTCCSRSAALGTADRLRLGLRREGESIAAAYPALR